MRVELNVLPGPRDQAHDIAEGFNPELTREQGFHQKGEA
jgi:hypothetical protein